MKVLLLFAFICFFGVVVVVVVVLVQLGKERHLGLYFFYCSLAKFICPLCTYMSSCSPYAGRG